MQATPILPHNGSSGQPQNHKNRIIEGWISASEVAIEALFNWKTYLRVWQQYPASVPDDVFMSVVRDMAEAGLAEWLDASWADIDALRKVVTAEAAAEYCPICQDLPAYWDVDNDLVCPECQTIIKRGR